MLKLSIRRGKREADALREESLLDEATGLYNVRGLARRAQEIGAEAMRLRHGLACVAFATVPDPPHENGSDAEVRLIAERVGFICRRQGRLSDAIGRLAERVWSVAPSTNEQGARDVNRFVAHRCSVIFQRVSRPVMVRSAIVRLGFLAWNVGSM